MSDGLSAEFNPGERIVVVVELWKLWWGNSDDEGDVDDDECGANIDAGEGVNVDGGIV